MTAQSNIEKLLLQHTQDVRSGSFHSISYVLRYLLETSRVAGVDALNAILKGTAAGRVVKVPYRLAEMRKTTAMKDALADTAGTNLLGLADTAGSPLLGSTTNGGSTASVNESASFIHILGPDYVSGAAVTLRVRAKVSAARNVAQTVDAVVKQIGDGTLGSDICATAAQAITTAYANYDFTITPTGLVAGDRLQVDVYLATDDTGAAANGAASISEVSVRETIST